MNTAKTGSVCIFHGDIACLACLSGAAEAIYRLAAQDKNEKIGEEFGDNLGFYQGAVAECQQQILQKGI